VVTENSHEGVETAQLPGRLPSPVTSPSLR
jgi:hypothetical protein